MCSKGTDYEEYMALLWIAKSGDEGSTGTAMASLKNPDFQW
jgi:hypothetical protein